GCHGVGLREPVGRPPPAPDTAGTGIEPTRSRPLPWFPRLLVPASQARTGPPGPFDGLTAPRTRSRGATPTAPGVARSAITRRDGYASSARSTRVGKDPKTTRTCGRPAGSWRSPPPPAGA